MINSLERIKKRYLQFFGNTSLSLQYLIFASSIILLITSFSVLIGLSDYYSYREFNQNTLHLNSSRTAKDLESIINDLANAHKLIGQQIAKNSNPNHILKILNSYRAWNNRLNRILSWLSYDWVDSKDNILIAAGVILANPVNMSHRKYLQLAKKKSLVFYIIRKPVNCSY